MLRLCSRGTKRGLRAGSLSRSPFFTITDAPESKSRRFSGVVNSLRVGVVATFPLSFEGEGDNRGEVEGSAHSDFDRRKILGDR